MKLTQDTPLAETSPAKNFVCQALHRPRSPSIPDSIHPGLHPPGNSACMINMGPCFKITQILSLAKSYFVVAALGSTLSFDKIAKLWPSAPDCCPH